MVTERAGVRHELRRDKLDILRALLLLPPPLRLPQEAGRIVSFDFRKLHFILDEGDMTFRKLKYPTKVSGAQSRAGFGWAWRGVEWRWTWTLTWEGVGVWRLFDQRS